jgi:hypothetical protein
MSHTKKSSGIGPSCGSPPMKFSDARRGWCAYLTA